MSLNLEAFSYLTFINCKKTQTIAMKPIILHIGDQVHHKTLGDGVVISVDDDYCTARFGEKEASFRISDAFVRGFLSSVDEGIGCDEGGKERPVEEILPEKKNGVGGCVIALVIFLGLVGFLPFFAYFLWQYGKTGDSSNLVGIAIFSICFLLYVPLAIFIVKRTGTPKEHTAASSLDLMSKIEVGILGSEVIHRVAEKEKQKTEKRRYDSLYWQESIRDKNPRHDYDYDKMDD